ncbi:type II secretion system F family protein [Isoptericola sp. b441]|uniref:Type II secretion system F family protein n=1 Tax=Actinotalea lenta TaxID=3064654 RepID=A0ABT9DAD0_9CELL|nr:MULTISPECIES: type II secretion system F family protein [unclassified Isoptericola]MDO8107093.1 type II secretion system F family protein [Isoptericola sp. b441]MDO8121193.1 type II secretion system F family protein [Isoptericola sp. b490]
MGVVAGLLLGAGLVLVMWAVTSDPAAARHTPRWQQSLADLLVQAGAPAVRPAALLGTSAGAAALVGLVVAGLTRAPAIAACFALMAGYAPMALVRTRARRRRAAMRGLWPDVVDHLASAIRAGLSLPEALGQLGDRGPEELRAPFAAFAEDYRVTGRFAECLDALKGRLADPVADRIVEALRLTRDVGGTDLGRQLRTLAGFLRADERTRGELEARQSWSVNAARLAVAAPWVVLALLATRPEATRAYDTPTGALVLAAGGASSVVAYHLMLRIGRLPEDARVLR